VAQLFLLKQRKISTIFLCGLLQKQKFFPKKKQKPKQTQT